MIFLKLLYEALLISIKYNLRISQAKVGEEET